MKIDYINIAYYDADKIVGPVTGIDFINNNIDDLDADFVKDAVSNSLADSYHYILFWTVNEDNVSIKLFAMKKIFVFEEFVWIPISVKELSLT